MACVCASDANDTAMASEDAGLELSADNEMEDNLQTNEENPALAVGDNDETVSVETDSEILTDDQFNYTYLKEQIGSGGNKSLIKGTYTYHENDGNSILITDSGVIDGNGAVIDMAGFNKRAFFVVNTSGVTIKNLTIKNANVSGNGGAIFFTGSGNVTNCEFINNSAGYGGAIDIENSGSVTNCNFINNTATKKGGAIWMYSGSIENCYFAHNSANEGGSILSYTWGAVTADTCIFKTSSDEPSNTYNLPPTLNVDNLTTFHGSGEKLTFDLKTNSGTPVTNGNISISLYFKNNDSWVGNYSCLSGEGWTVDLPVGSYYAIFYTEYAEFQPINRTITITLPAIQYYVDVTSLVTNNRTVNITAESNIPDNLFWGSKLLFIVPNSDPITANYAGNGTWWALHTFDGFAKYKVKASYIGFDNVTISNATVTIDRANSTITLDNVVLDYGDSIKVNVKTDGALAITAMIDGEDVGVIKYAIPISGLDAGNHALTVTTIPDYDHVAVTKTVNITVNKIDSTLAVGDIVFDYGADGSCEVSFTGATGVNASVIGQPDANVNVAGNTIAVSGLNVGTFNLTVTTIADANHNNITKTATITVNKLKTELKAAAISTTYNINKDLVISLTDAKGNPLSGVIIGVNLGSGKFTTDRNGQVKINVANLVPKTYTAKITFNGDTNYDKSTNDVKVTVTKATPKLTATKKTFKKSVKTKKYTVTLKTNLNKVMKGAKVTLKVKGKTYTATTNVKGQATFKIKNLKKKGKFAATVKFAGNAYYNAATKKVKIIVK
jgi:predicted outer membrane repeat protein